jgi:hypothetical protein
MIHGSFQGASEPPDLVEPPTASLDPSELTFGSTEMMPHHSGSEPQPLLVVAGLVGEDTKVRVRVLVDTGANISLISKGTVDAAGQSHRMKIMPAPFKVLSASQHHIPLLGFVTLPPLSNRRAPSTS